VGSGLAWLGKSLMQYLVQEVATVRESKGQEIPAAGNSVTKDLSPREKEIAHLVAAGLHNHVIGENLGITERTVKAHLSAIYSKTGANGRLDLALRINRSA
jgi:DNA-binding NarL/FixJ family response regulator